MPKVIGVNRFIDVPDLEPSLAEDVVPTGTILTFGGDVAPAGFLLCNGSQVSRTTFAALFATIGTRHGVGNGSTTFHLPDPSGKFFRCMDFNLLNDPDRANRTQAIAGTFTVGGATVGVSPTVSISSTANLAPGMTVALGGFIPASTVVRSITNATTFIMGNLSNSANVSGLTTGTGLTLTFSNSPVGNYVGSIQGHAYTSHTHTVQGNNASTGVAGIFYAGNSGGNQLQTSSGPSTGSGAETRPLNFYGSAIIKT